MYRFDVKNSSKNAKLNFLYAMSGEASITNDEFEQLTRDFAKDASDEVRSAYIEAVFQTRRTQKVKGNTYGNNPESTPLTNEAITDYFFERKNSTSLTGYDFYGREGLYDASDKLYKVVDYMMNSNKIKNPDNPILKAFYFMSAPDDLGYGYSCILF